MKKRFVHIGYPKCGSTTLQSDFFGFHPDIYFLGVGVNNGNPFPERYLDENLAIAFEMDLRYRKEQLLDMPKLKTLFDMHFQQAEHDSNKKIVAASNELLSFTFSYDIEITQKAERLFMLFGKETKIIIFIRNQFDLIRSMYSEYVKCGSYLTFEQFFDYSFLHDYKFFISDLLYDKTINIYSDYFGKENIHIILFEEFIKDYSFGLSNLCELMEIGKPDSKVGHKNASLKWQSLDAILEFNFNNRNNLGNSLHEGSQMQRLNPFLNKEKGGIYPDKIREDHRLRKEIMAIDSDLEKFLRKKNSLKSKIRNKLIKPIKFTQGEIKYSKNQKEIINNYYRESNKQLAKEYNLNLEGLGYPL